MKWQDSFQKATPDDIIKGKLRVPSITNSENIILVTSAVDKLRTKLVGWVDCNVDYIDNYGQYKDAVAYNSKISDSIKMLNEKLENWMGR